MKTTANIRPDNGSLRLRISNGGKTSYFNLGVRLKSYEISNGKVVRHSESKKLNERIKYFTLEAENLFYQGVKEPKEIVHLLSKEKQSTSFYDIFEERIETSRRSHSIGYVRHLEAVLNKMRKFRPELNIYDLDYRFIVQFENHLYSIGNKKNTVSTNMAKVKSTFNYATRFVDDLKNPFLDYKISYEVGKDKYLTAEEIQKLADLNVLGSLRIAKDAFMFSLYTAGTRWGDICRLKDDNVRDGRFKYRMNKNSKERNFILTPEAIEIYDRYKGKGRLFPFLPIGLKGKQEHMKIQSANYIVNKNLKKLSALAGIPIFTFHSARHSFAELANLNGIPIQVLQNMFGHADLKTTQNYMSSRFPQQEADKAINLMFG